jgi:DNA-binding Xre family transcriptional regulator
MSRSLRTTPQGIELAKRALARKNLTQKAIANELGIASWATINKFFTGKPIDRFIFQEICQTLDLDWQNMVESVDRETMNDESITINNESGVQPYRSTHSATHLLSLIQNQAHIARQSLTPRILERIPRAIVRDKYLVAIARGQHQSAEQGKVIPIIAPAGYGKSTILGDIYDELIAAETPWVGLILCSSVSIAPTYLYFTSGNVIAATYAPVVPQTTTTPTNYQTSAIDAALGQSLSGTSQSLVAIAQDLTQQQGRGVLLIDTLDLIISRDFTPIFNHILRQLLEQGTTIVFTCRDHEYNDFLEPTRDRFMGIAERVDRHSVPNFTTTEICTAAETFFRKLDPTHPERGKNFANNILTLSADNRSLQDIIQNPLLLALLCDLFAQDGNVPPDLTVSKLYQRYWQEKVAYSRVDQSSDALLAIEKEQICLAIARSLFEQSTCKLCESAYRDEFGIQFTESIVKAYNELLSEGVLALLPSRKVHFFHQTLLEYAIAYWLTRHAAIPQRDQLLAWMCQPSASKQHSHHLPILRQYLTIVDESEFEGLIAQLSSQDVGIFGVIAYAAASRDRPDALRRLLPIALEFGESHQRRLRQALRSAPRQLVEATWDILLSTLQQSDHATAGNTAQLAGSLLAEWWDALSDRLADTLKAIAQRPHNETHPDEPAMFSGWFLQPCFPLIQQSPQSQLLTTLQQYLAILGYKTTAAVIEIHTLPNIPIEVQNSLLQQLLLRPVPEHDAVRNALCQLTASMLPHALAAGFPLGQSWTEILYNAFPKGWDVVQARAIGQWAAHDPSFFTTLLQDYGSGRSSDVKRSLIALSESLVQGGSSHLPPALIQMDIAQLSPEIFQRFTALLNRRNMATLSVDQQEAIARWLQPHASERLSEMYLALDVLADTSITAHQTLEQWIVHLPTEQQTAIQVRSLRFQPIDKHPPITQLDKPSQRSLIQVYRQRATTDPLALQRLLEIAQYRSKDIALAASTDLEQVYPQISPTQLFPLLQSIFPGVRASALNRLSPSFMATVIYQGCPILVEQGWLRNVSAVVKAAATIEGGRSPLLDRLQQLDCCTPPVDSMILAVRGL